MITSVTEYLINSANKYPQKIAFSDEKKALTYYELKRQVDIYANILIDVGLGHGNPIAVIMDKSVDCVVTFLAILRAGSFYCPIDEHMPTDRIEKIFGKLEPKAIIYDKVNAALLDKLNFKTKAIAFEEEFQEGESPKVNFNREIEAKVIDSDLAYVMFTSGTTGTPKGVTISHRALIDLIEWSIVGIGLSSNDVLANQAPFHFDMSVPDIYCTISVGSTMHIISNKAFLFPMELLKQLNDKKVNYLSWVPTALVNVVNLKALDKVTLKYLKRVLFNGEVMPTKQLNAWRRKYPNVDFINMYGPTEATFGCTYYHVKRAFDDDESLPIGYPCANSQIMIFDDDLNLITEHNIIGELYIRGACLSNGYYNDTEKTGEAFTQNPLHSAYIDKIYKTGDLVKYNQYGEIIYVGRKDNQVKHRGFRIELGEIEVAGTSIEGVERGCSVYDDVKKQILFFYTGTKSEKIVFEEIRRKLPEYMIPNRVMRLDNLPLNLNGKLDRKKLREKYLGL